MAERQTRLTQQVVDMGHWGETNRVVPPSDHPWSVPTSVTEREKRLEDIRQAVEADIVPRLVQSHDRAYAPAAIVPVAAEVIAFVKILLSHQDEATIVAHVAAVQARGVSVDDIYLQLFQPTARYIGELWCDDLCSFIDVTLAVGTMQKLLRMLAPIFHANGRPEDGSRQALIVPLPGDQHTFGLSMVAEFMRRAGWSIWSTPFASIETLSETLGKLYFVLVGYSVSSDERLDELTKVIRQTRRASCNKAIRILVGGPVFVARPDYVTRVGADAMGTDAPHALSLAESFVASAA
ncbi:cobalamin B12-binding domain-containing protein [Lichenifustis flavocetrariae]|uniref:Cobalamin-dependent protein n=1 Tax=Lichenifustis flavocetrariae TaxID=2949735 RepID=A0AA41YYR7_9HYPH|nr:cobalamin-dependent protein [Lichenifustis flavocetrariae]MCW6507300.1 cobalamin-dependent protein [Lichenifustis flavocetrariae]